jgi:hypothetical protein
MRLIRPSLVETVFGENLLPVEKRVILSVGTQTGNDTTHRKESKF